MFQIVLTLHIVGAVLSLAAIGLGSLAALLRRGSSTKLKSAFAWLSAYEILTGVLLVALRPSTAALTTFCIGGAALIAMFWAVYVVADKRIPQPAA